MPFIRATVLHDTASSDIIDRLHAELSRLAIETLGKAGDLVSVLVEPPAGQGTWRIGGRTVTRAAHVSISVTAGTNTAEEKAAFVEGAYGALRAVLGTDLPEATYVIVDEVPADAWGYGGMTGAARRARTVV